MVKIVSNAIRIIVIATLILPLLILINHSGASLKFGIVIYAVLLMIVTVQVYYETK